MTTSKNPIRKSGIYEIRCTANGRFYVGASSHIAARWASHRAALRARRHHSPHLQRCWDKHGEAAFTFGVIEECDRAKLMAAETFWIWFLRPELNAMANVQQGRGWSNEARERIAAQRRGTTIPEATRRVMSAAQLRRWAALSVSERDKHRQHTSAAMQGHTVSESSRRRMIQTKIASRPTCPYGHSYTGIKGNARTCRECTRAADRRRYYASRKVPV